MTKVCKQLSTTGVTLALAGSVSQVLGADVRPDPLLSIDQNRPVAIERTPRGRTHDRAREAHALQALVRDVLGAIDPEGKYRLLRVLAY